MRKQRHREKSKLPCRLQVEFVAGRIKLLLPPNQKSLVLIPGRRKGKVK